jgi:predicted Zn-dependent protease
MKRSMVLMAMTAMLAVASQASAQLGGILNKAQKIQEAKGKFDDLNVTEEEERKIGEDVSAKIRQRFGVVQDPAIHKYVSLVGTALAEHSERPGLAWTFIVLDTDGVNAFASPGGIVHITRGALGLITNEAELAGVLAHEVGHVAHKHAVNAIRKGKAVQLGSNETLSSRGPFLDKIANKAYDIVLENKFDRNDEMDSDKVSLTLAEKAGYAPGKLADFLTRLDERNKDQPASNGLFASHPDTQARIEAIKKLAGTKTGAIVEARYKSHVKYKPTPVTSIATVEDGSSGLTGSTAAKKDDGKKEETTAKKEEEPKKKGFGLGALKQTVAPERQSTQVSASGGSRGVGPDRAAKGGSNATLVKVTVTAVEMAEFKKGIA